MLDRLIQLPKEKHFLLFGPRGTGKSTWLRACFPDALWINLLDHEEEQRFSNNPNELAAIVRALVHDENTIHTIVIDEIQKVPKLLDIVHLLIEEKHPVYFVMTGSSARKLKRGSANLLAGRAFVYHLFPFSFLELNEEFSLQTALNWGLLPAIYAQEDDESRQLFLTAYANTYLKEEIVAEQLVKNLNPFRRFLEVAAQMNGKIINFSSIARDVGVPDGTVKEYFSILEDTLIGFFLEPFHHSFRKRLLAKPKFYFFDTGITRALARTLQISCQEGTSMYGEIFEHLVILECIKLATYHNLDYRFSYLSTKDGAEIDLVVDRPGKRHLFIEIKSATQIFSEDLRTVRQLAQDFKTCEALCFSRDTYVKELDGVTVYPWQQGVAQFFSRGTTH